MVSIKKREYSITGVNGDTLADRLIQACEWCEGVSYDDYNNTFTDLVIQAVENSIPRGDAEVLSAVDDLEESANYYFDDYTSSNSGYEMTLCGLLRFAWYYRALDVLDNEAESIIYNRMVDRTNEILNTGAINLFYFDVDEFSGVLAKKAKALALQCSTLTLKKLIQETDKEIDLFYPYDIEI